jgi:hypothetical protein
VDADRAQGAADGGSREEDEAGDDESDSSSFEQAPRNGSIFSPAERHQ